MAKHYEEENYHAILSKVAEETGYSKTEVYTIYNAFRDAIVNTLNNGKSVKLPRLATFELVDRPARRHRSPYNGEYFTSEPKTIVKVRNKKDLIEVSDHVKPKEENLKDEK